MVRRSLVIHFLGWPFLCLVLSLSAVLFLRHRHSPPPVPLTELLVRPSMYSAAWRQEGAILVNEDDLGADIGNVSVHFRTITPDDNISVHRIWRFASPTDAHKAFDHQMARHHGRSPDLRERAEITLPPLVVQRMWVQCTDRPGPTPLCLAMGQYGAYVSQVSAYVETPTMSYEAFTQLVRRIDHQLAVVGHEEALASPRK